MEKKSYAVLDVMKFVSALLVIAIHCAPFIQINEDVNFIFVQVFARLAVPFFFITSGFLFFRKIDARKGWKDPSNVKQLKHYWLRILRVYAVWSVLYLPLLAYSWYQGGFDASTLVRLLRDFLFNGTYYHLWFLPALLLAIPFVYVLYTTCKKRTMLIVTLLLYIIGMLFNIYGSLLVDVPVVSTIVKGYESALVTTRNGIFFGPIFITLGIFAKGFTKGNYRRPAGIAFLVSLFLLWGEASLLWYMGIMHDLASMYIMLIPCIFFLFIFLLGIHLRTYPVYKTMRKMSLLIYVSHIYFIYIFLNILHMGNLPVYGFSILCSGLFSYIIVKLSNKLPWLNILS